MLQTFVATCCVWRAGCVLRTERYARWVWGGQEMKATSRVRRNFVRFAGVNMKPFRIWVWELPANLAVFPLWPIHVHAIRSEEQADRILIRCSPMFTVPTTVPRTPVSFRHCRSQCCESNAREIHHTTRPPTHTGTQARAA